MSCSNPICDDQNQRQRTGVTKGSTVTITSKTCETNPKVNQNQKQQQIQNQKQQQIQNQKQQQAQNQKQQQANQIEINLDDLSKNQLKNNKPNNNHTNRTNTSETLQIIPSVSISQPPTNDVGNGKIKNNNNNTSKNSSSNNSDTESLSNLPAISVHFERASSTTPTLYFAADDWTFNYKGILLPKLTNDFKDSHLESAYQRYSHRQRQKSLVILNVIDILLKLVLLVIYSGHIYFNDKDDLLSKVKYRLFYNLPWFIINILVICLITLWKQFANNYLHLAAIFTWIIFNIQGCCSNFNHNN